MEPTILTISRAATLALCAALYAAQGYAHGEHAKRDAPLGAQQEHARHRLPQTVGEAQRVSIRLENLQLLDQHNQAVRFAEQVVGDQLIALSIFYSSCTTVCPVSQVQPAPASNLRAWAASRRGVSWVGSTLRNTSCTSSPSRAPRRCCTWAKISAITGQTVVQEE